MLKCKCFFFRGSIYAFIKLFCYAEIGNGLILCVYIRTRQVCVYIHTMYYVFLWGYRVAGETVTLFLKLVGTLTSLYKEFYCV